MSGTNIIKKQHEIEKLHGVAKAKKAQGFLVENQVMVILAKFGWLTSYQVANFLWPDKKNGQDRSRKILSRLLKENFITCVTLSQKGNEDKGDPELSKKTKVKKTNMKAYFLKKKGMTRILEFPNFSAAIRIKKTSKKITNVRYQYHRFLANQFLIDVRKRRVELPFDLATERAYLCEHEMSPMRSDLNSHFGCVPDGLIVDENGLLLVLEVENSTRGPLKHGWKEKKEGNKLEGWLPVYIDRIRAEGFYSDHLLSLGAAGAYTDCKEVFLCASEKEFRSIWRMVDHILGRFKSIKGYFYYCVLKERKWNDPLASDNVTWYEHTDARITSILAEADPMGRSYRVP